MTKRQALRQRIRELERRVRELEQRPPQVIEHHHHHYAQPAAPAVPAGPVWPQPPYIVGAPVPTFPDFSPLPPVIALTVSSH